MTDITLRLKNYVTALFIVALVINGFLWFLAHGVANFVESREFANTANRTAATLLVKHLQNSLQDKEFINSVASQDNKKVPCSSLEFWTYLDLIPSGGPPTVVQWLPERLGKMREQEGTIGRLIDHFDSSTYTLLKGKYISSDSVLWEGYEIELSNYRNMMQDLMIRSIEKSAFNDLVQEPILSETDLLLSRFKVPVTQSRLIVDVQENSRTLGRIGTLDSTLTYHEYAVGFLPFIKDGRIVVRTWVNYESVILHPLKKYAFVGQLISVIAITLLLVIRLTPHKNKNESKF